MPDPDSFPLNVVNEQHGHRKFFGKSPLCPFLKLRIWYPYNISAIAFVYPSGGISFLAWFRILYFIRNMILPLSSLPRVYPLKSLYNNLRDCCYTWRNFFFTTGHHDVLRLDFISRLLVVVRTSELGVTQLSLGKMFPTYCVVFGNSRTTRNIEKLCVT